jgi:hypothetical protein
MTIYRTLLTRGYFPKELPPSFYSAEFAKYATTLAGRAMLAAYKPPNKSTECVTYQLALPGQDRRELRIVHPFGFAQIASIAAKNLSRFLKIAGSSPFSKSRPIYAADRYHSISPRMRPTDLTNERAAIRAGASVLLTTDISQFYPALYTHAVAWAIDPKARNNANWNKKGFLPADMDRALRNANAKITQGIPIGNDISFLLAEIVLARADEALPFPKERAYRWFDDYEIAFDTQEQAEAGLASLRRALGSFKLRVNPAKTKYLCSLRSLKPHGRKA